MGDVLKELRIRDFAKEICIIAGLMLYIFNMIMGSKANKHIANKWCMLFGIGNGILPQQFAHVGIGELSASPHQGQAFLQAKPPEQTSLMSMCRAWGNLWMLIRTQALLAIAILRAVCLL